MEQIRKNIWLIVAVAIIIALVAGYLYFFKLKPEKKGAVGTAEKVSAGVPKITTNAADKVPEVNPLDRANPFKYTNPLR